MGKHEEFFKKVPMNGRKGCLRFMTEMDGNFLNWESMSIRYGLVDEEGVIPEETDKLHVHDYDEAIMFLSQDANDMLTLGGELEVTLGTDGVRHRIDLPSIVSIPAGTPHFSPKVRKVDRPFLYFSVAFNKEFKAEVTDEQAVQGEGPWIQFRAPYFDKVNVLNFAIRDPYHYASDVPEDSGGIGTLVDTHVAGFPMMCGWQTVGKPHNMGPRRDDGKRHPHAHEDFDEMLAFFSLDPDNLTDLHGEFEFSLGAEGDEERYVCSEAAVFPMRKGYFHLPLVFTKVDKPFIFFTLSRNMA